MTLSLVSKQSAEVQTLCRKFTDSYNKNRKTVAQWGEDLQAIRDSKLVPFEEPDSNAKPEDVHDTTFAGICRELGIPRSTAYHYINVYLIVSTYPVWLQDAATKSGINLAAEHVQTAYLEMQNELPKEPSPLEADGVIGRLKQAKPPRAGRPAKSAQEKLHKLLSEAVKIAKENNIEAAIITETLETLLATSFGMPGARVTREKAPIYQQGGNS